MRAIFKLSNSSDIWGSFASGLCLIHCIATPLLFAAQTGHISGNHFDLYGWDFVDVFFVLISLLAICWSVKNTSKRWMKYALWASWTLLLCIILNEKIQTIKIAEEFIYLPSISLIFLHIYNRNYCQCGKKKCCINTPEEFDKK